MLGLILVLAAALALALVLRRPGLAVPSAAALCSAVAIPILLAGLTSRTSGSTTTVHHSSSEPEPPVTFPPGKEAAPNFHLVDENGHSVSLSAYRGKPVIVTFIDPLCRHLCPLAGHVLSNTIKELPAAERPEIIAVSVDIYADKPADLFQDFSRWHLPPQWQWAVGKPSQLAAVWKGYGAEVSVETKHIAGTTVHYIGHSEMAYLIDAKGYERNLFVWPYTRQQVDAAVRSLARS